MIHISGIKTEYRKIPERDRRRFLTVQAAKWLGIPETDILELKIRRESIDARRKPEVYYLYAVDVLVKNEDVVFRQTLRERNAKNQRGRMQRTGGSGVEISRGEEAEYHFPQPGKKQLKHSVVIVGTGPAGLFCGYFLALHGYRPILLERGKAVEDRQEDVEQFWKSGVLLPDSNVQFGEGGAGTFSDGKLNTLVKDKEGRNRAVLQVFADCGAPEEILYQAKPHIGTDVLCRVVRRMRDEILRNGGSVRFESKMTELLLEDGRVCGVMINGEEHLACDQLVLAIGHSARDTFSMLYEKKVPMEAKSFAVGLRVEHAQKLINRSQYGTEEPDGLGAAPYKTAAKADDGRGVYSFCMCPGGYVVNASSEQGYLAVNGMSYSGRRGENANSAIIVSVTPQDFGSEHPLAGVEFQRRLEKKAFSLAEGKIPMQRFGVFRDCVEKEVAQEGLDYAIDAGTGMPLGESPQLSPAHKGQSAWADVSRILPEACNRAFVRGMEVFGRQIKGFDRKDVILSGVESRTSSPVRIGRDDTMQSEVRGLYPCGEGAGYAGGITSAAMDGLRVAEAIAAEFAPVSGK